MEKVQLPSIFLMVIAFLGILNNIGGLILGIVGSSRDLIDSLFRQNVDPEALKLLVEMQDGPTLIASSIFGLFVSGIVLIGAFQMSRMRTFPLAVIASVAAMTPFYGCCCCLGLPVGIWSLVVLFNDDVKRAFS